MESLIILIPLALIIVALAVGIFFWAVDNEQFDDLEGPAHSILFDDDIVKKNGPYDQ
ncbi:cbb3-type cytochrome oxidase assembly protein CcoS [Candidatus Sororendozoicomonas aggregata]|uniref:cbb3-type cytochrome oxidase assembly protein CcoS n=1 Tax=Candidatus Sororendozoicomonas aggregata TaxID=3073239 RepID=UPI002ED1B9E7